DWSRFQEQIYVHTDKPYYYIGDTIWMKGYVGYSQPMWRDSLSRTAYVELVDRTNQLIVASKIVKLDSGLFFNELVIPTVPETRNYYLRVYTNLNRNFGDNTLYVKPIPILYSTEYLKMEQVIEPVAKPVGISLEPITLNPIPGKPFELLLQTNDQQNEPVASHFSVSVTDMTKVAPIQVGDPIQKALSVNDPILKPFKKVLDYPIEYGISFSVKPQGISKTTGVYQIVQVDQANFTLADLTSDGLVHIKGLVFYDTGRFVIQHMEGKKSDQVKYNLAKRAVVPISFQDVDLKLKRERLEAGQGNNLTEEQLRNTKVLRDVQVKANRTTIEKPLDRVERPFGKPDYIITRQQLNTSYGNLLQTLPGKVPGLIVRQGSNPNGGLEWFVYLAKGGESSSVLNPAEVLVTINDVVVTGKPEQILSAIDPNSVETIEVKTGVNVLYGSLGGNGILAVYTRKDFESNVGKPELVTALRVPGYAKPKPFKQRLTSVPATVYWNPWMKTNAADGKAIIKFNAPLFSGKYRIVVEGINSLGEPFSIQKIFEVVE
ncbi:MAG: TonB-dependent receptor, partial [Cyclobacteriaceae bacterium]